MCHCKKQKKCKIACVKSVTNLNDAGLTNYQYSGCKYTIPPSCSKVMGGTSNLYTNSWEIPKSLNNSSPLSANTGLLG
jgi:hypothetical protein